MRRSMAWSRNVRTFCVTSTFEMNDVNRQTWRFELQEHDTQAAMTQVLTALNITGRNKSVAYRRCPDDAQSCEHRLKMNLMQ